MIEVVESDFTKGLAVMTTAEETSARDYEAQTKESTGLDKAISELTSDREGVQTELDAIFEYMSKLNEECIAKAEPYEERKARREAEIDGLEEALKILEGESVLLQSSRQTRLRGVRPAA